METNGMPDLFDRLLGELHGVQGIIQTKPSTIRVVTPMTGNSELFTVQTLRNEGDYIFLERTSTQGYVRIALPPAVADAIARQRDSLSAKSRSRSAKEKAQARMKRGELPGFMRNKK